MNTYFIKIKANLFLYITSWLLTTHLSICQSEINQTDYFNNQNEDVLLKTPKLVVENQDVTLPAQSPIKVLEEVQQIEGIWMLEGVVVRKWKYITTPNSPPIYFQQTSELHEIVIIKKEEGLFSISSCESMEVPIPLIQDPKSFTLERFAEDEPTDTHKQTYHRKIELMKSNKLNGFSKIDRFSKTKSYTSNFSYLANFKGVKISNNTNFSEIKNTVSLKYDERPFDVINPNISCLSSRIDIIENSNGESTLTDKYRHHASTVDGDFLALRYIEHNLENPNINLVNNEVFFKNLNKQQQFYVKYDNSEIESLESRRLASKKTLFGFQFQIKEKNTIDNLITVEISIQNK